jgi:hypothetical protein
MIHWLIAASLAAFDGTEPDPGTIGRNAWRTEGAVANGHYGTAVASAGDVNGDGYSDLLVGSPNRTNDQGAAEAGRAELFLGGPDGLATTAAWRVDGTAGQHVGRSVASAGDVDGDGFDDVLVGAPGAAFPAPIAGRVWLYFGSAAGLASQPDRELVDIAQAGSLFGICARSAGDVNGDGFADIVVGATNRSGATENGGTAFLYLGSPAGPGSSPSWTAESDTQHAAFGLSLGTAGDVNGDGYDDVVVGAYAWAIWSGPFSTSFGRAYVFHGSAAGLSPTPALVLTGGVADDYGYSVGAAGDVNGDGYDDVIIGAPERAALFADQGAAMVHYGSAAGLSPTAAWTILGSNGTQLLGSSVAGAGDVNGDGYADVIVGVPWFPGFPRTPEFVGRAMVFTGSANGLSIAPAWSTTGRVEFGNLGRAVAAAGDTDGDGFDDVAIGVPFEGTPKLPQHGSAWVRMGSFWGVR